MLFIVVETELSHAPLALDAPADSHRTACRAFLAVFLFPPLVTAKSTFLKQGLDFRIQSIFGIFGLMYILFLQTSRTQDCVSQYCRLA